MVFKLDDELWFPDPSLADEDGCLAVGGDLSIDRLLLAYQNGIFPWFSFRDNDEPVWYCPKRRFVIFPKEIHISHSMRTLLRKDLYQFSVNMAFEDVIRNCSRLRIDEDGAWLGDPEGWDERGKLVGGLYGVNIGNAFFGESMFSLVPSGSKLALIYLAKTLEELGGTIIDCQIETAHLRSMGGRYISYKEYMRLITPADSK